MGEFSQSIAIVYPSNWPVEDLAHCTMIYVGEISKVDFTKEDLTSTLDQFVWPKNSIVPTGNLEYFGPNKNISVVTLKRTSYLYLARLCVEDALKLKGIINASEYKDYRPHITVPDPTLAIPQFVELSAPVVWWGDDRSS